MKQKALRKDFFMEVRKTLNRFLSIFLIVALGVAFFSGVRASEPDMELSADRFYDESRYMDVRVLSTLGLTEEDAEALSRVDGVGTAEPSHSVDVLSMREDGEHTLKVLSLTRDLNRITPTEGRLPERPGECILDSGLAEMGYRVGDVVTVRSGTDEEIGESLRATEFTVVGMGISPAYLSLQRESSQIGRGSVDGFMAILDEDFAMDVYTEIYLSVEGAREEVSYRDAYEDRVDGVIDRIEEIRPEREEARTASIRGDAQDAISDAKEELADGKREADEELAKARKELRDAKAEIADGKKELKDAKAKIADGEEELKESRERIADERERLADGKRQLSEGEKEYEAGKSELEESKEKAAKGREQIEAAKAELAAQEETLAASGAELAAQEEALSAQEAQFLAAKEAGLLDEATASAGEAELAKAREELSAYEEEAKAGEKELAKARESLAKEERKVEKGEKEIKDGEAELAKAREELDRSREEIARGERELAKGERAIEAAEAEIADGKKEIARNERKLADAEDELAKGRKEYRKAKRDAKAEIEDAEAEIADAEAELADLKPAEWYVLGRDYSQIYAEFGQNAERIGAIGEVFPVFFFLIAALVSLTTIARMVEEERTQIGTLKALGYGKAAIAGKYLAYAGLASLGGGVFGALAGQKVFPLVIVNAYRMMYVNLPYCLLPYNAWYSVSSVLAMLACTVLAAFFACYRELSSNAAQLMRPEAPKAGKRVLLERAGFLWGRLSFAQKASVRNLFRYKKRFFMTVLGIGGCMALLLVGFGLRDSIFNIAQFQYEELFDFTGYIMKAEDAKEEDLELLRGFLEEGGDVASYLPVCQKSVDLSAGDGTERSASLICPERPEEFGEYVRLRDRRTKEEYSLSEGMDGAILTEKMGSLLGIRAGDEITVKVDDATRVRTRVLALTENYSLHYLYVTPGLYAELFGEEPEYNLVYYQARDESEAAQDAFARKALSYEAASEVFSNLDQKANVEDMLDALNIVVYVLILSAGLLAFVVLYNLNNININERKRELATLRVLGFYNREVGAYVYRESAMLTVIGIVAGAFLGIALHRYVILTAEIDMLMFGREIQWPSYLYSAALTILFSVLINWVMYFRLKRIDMVESLKSVE